jgi:hypothetical protein
MDSDQLNKKEKTRYIAYQKKRDKDNQPSPTLL